MIEHGKRGIPTEHNTNPENAERTGAEHRGSCRVQRMLMLKQDEYKVFCRSAISMLMLR